MSAKKKTLLPTLIHLVLVMPTRSVGGVMKAPGAMRAPGAGIQARRAHEVPGARPPTERVGMTRTEGNQASGFKAFL